MSSSRSIYDLRLLDSSLPAVRSTYKYYSCTRVSRIDTLVLHQVLFWIIEREGNWGVLALAPITTQLAADRFHAPLCLGVAMNPAVGPLMYKNLNRIVLMWNRLLQCWRSVRSCSFVQEIKIPHWTFPQLCKTFSDHFFILFFFENWSKLWAQ